MEKITHITEESHNTEKENIQKRLEQFHREIQSNPEFGFIYDLKRENPDIGVYFVGGLVRDVVSGKKSKDIDLVVNHIETSRLIDLLFEKGKLRFKGGYERYFGDKSDEEKERLMNDSFGILKFKPEGSESDHYVDIGYPREDDHSLSGSSGISGVKRDVRTVVDQNMDIEKDLKRRDFTINAMAIDPFNGKLIDRFGGLNDILNNRIRMVGSAKERINEQDMSRGFRAMRFSTELKADIDDDIIDALCDMAKPAPKGVHDIFTDEEKLQKALLYENNVRDLFKIPKGENMPVFLQTVWDEEKNKPQTATSRNDVEKEVKKALDADPVRYFEILQKTGLLKILFPEAEGIDSKDIEIRHKRFSGLDENASEDLKLAVFFYGLGKINFRNIKDISLRFNFSKNLSRSLTRLLGRANKFFDELNTIGGEDLKNMFTDDPATGKELIKLIRLNLNDLSEEDQEKAKELLVYVEKLFNKKQLKSRISPKKLREMGYHSGPEIRDIMNLLRDMENKGKKINKNDIERAAKKLNLK